MALALLVAFFLLFLSLSMLLPTSRNKHNLPPGPAKLPFIGNLHQLFTTQLPHRSLHKLSREHGPIMYLKLGKIPTIVVSSADMAKEFLKTYDLDSCSRPSLTSVRKFSYGFSDVAFTPYGEQWKEMRKIWVAQLFSMKKVVSFQNIREEEVERMTSAISFQRRSTVNLGEELLLLSNNIACRTSFGKRSVIGDKGRLHEIISETQALLNGFFFADYFPMLGWLDVFTRMRKRLETNFHELDGFYQQVIDEHRDYAIRQQNDQTEDVTDSLLEIQRRVTHITDGHIKGILMNIFVAGSDTVSATVEWAMAELMRNPQALTKTQDEVRSLVGNKGKVEETDLDKLDYLKSVVKETMRLHPPGPLLLPRETIQHCKIKGYDIPAKTRLLINAFAIGRDADSWENVEEFNPQRFMESWIDYTGQDFRFIPFGAGRRICPGKHFGILVAELALANLLYLFDWGFPEGVSKEDIDMVEAPGLAVHMKSGLCLVPTRYL